jgi:lipopolysaccharide export system permease protein
MRILDRYILKSVLSTFFTCLFTFLMLYVVIDIFSRLEDILKQKMAFSALLHYYVAYQPVIFIQVAPFAGLLATLYAFGKFNRDNELIAMRASGLSILQISKTIIIFGSLLSLLIFWMGDKLVPLSMAAQKKFIQQLDSWKKSQDKEQSQEISNLSMYGMKNRLFFVSKFSLAEKSMEGITILEHDEHQNIVKKIVANSGIFKDGVWTFYHCITYNFDINGQIKDEPQYFAEEMMVIPETPQEFFTQRQHPDSMSIAQLEDYLWKLSKSGATGVIRNLKVDLYQKYTSSLMSLVMIMIGIPFALMMRKRATGMSSLGVSIIAGFLYYVFNAVSIALGKAGVLPPILAASMSHLIFLTFSVYLIARLP